MLVCEEGDDLVLQPVGILVLIHEDVLVLLAQLHLQYFVVAQSIAQPAYLVAVVVESTVALESCICIEEFGAGLEALHTLLFLRGGWLEVARKLVFVLALVDVLLKVGQVEDVVIGCANDVFGGPAFLRHLSEQPKQVFPEAIGLVVGSAHGVFWRKLIDEGVDEAALIELVHLLPIGIFEEGGILLDDPPREGVEGVHGYAATGCAHELDQSVAHRFDPCSGEGEAEDVARLDLLLEQDVADAGG